MLQIDELGEVTPKQWEYLATRVIAPKKLPVIHEQLPCCGFVMSFDPNTNVGSFYWSMRNSLSGCPSCGKKIRTKQQES